MEKIKSLLLPLALVFAAIAVFEFGARYGATNMRAYAIASELQFPLNIYTQAESSMDAGSKATFTSMIDNGIAVGAMHRELWYLKKDARAKLDSVLTKALTIRGDAPCERFTAMATSEDVPAYSQNKLSEICEAIKNAQADLMASKPASSVEQNVQQAQETAAK